MTLDAVRSSPVFNRSATVDRSLSTSTSNSPTSSTPLRDRPTDTFVRGGGPTPLLQSAPQLPANSNGNAAVDLYGTDDATVAPKTVTVPINLAAAYQTKNPELDAWRQAVQKAGYGDVMGFVEASRTDFNMIDTSTKKDSPNTLAEYKKANGGALPPTSSPYTLHLRDLDDARQAMKLGFDSLTEYQRYGLTDDKAARLTPDLQNALLATTKDGGIGAGSGVLAGLKDRGLADVGARLSNFTSVVRRQQAGEPGLEGWIADEKKALAGLATGSPLQRDIDGYVAAVLGGAQTKTQTQTTSTSTSTSTSTKELPGTGGCASVNVTVGPFTGGLSQCTNNKVYGTVGVTSAIGLSVDGQTAVVVPKDGKTVDDVVSGDSSGVGASSAKLGGTGSVTGNDNGVVVSGGPSLGVGLPGGVVKTTTVQLGTYVPPPPDTRKMSDIEQKQTPARRVMNSRLGVPQP